MGKFRKRPVEVEAVQWTGVRKQHEEPKWMTDAFNNEQLRVTERYGKPAIGIYTHAGIIMALEGDWIIRGTFGELYPCDNRAFKQIYEVIE